jgi:rhomboid protease GluP
MVAASSGMLVLRMTFGGSTRAVGWLCKSAGLLVLVLVLWWLTPDQAGLISGPIWGVLILGPILVSRSMTMAMVHRNWKRAALMARLLCILHPMDGLQNQPQVVRVLALIDEGRADEAADELAELRKLDTPLAWTAIVLEAKARGEWAELLSWLEQRDDTVRLLAHPPVVACAVRALGEIGRLDDMVEMFRVHGDTELLRKDVLGHGLMQAHVGAFLGRRTIVDAMLNGPLGVLPDCSAEFLLGTVEQAAGRPEIAAKHLEASRVNAHPSLLLELERRLQQPLSPLADDALTDENRVWIDGLAESTGHEQRFASLSTGTRKPTPATWSLCALLGAIFVVEMQGGAENLENLMRLGALRVPVELDDGEWWRRIAAGFLHFGMVHLVMNLAALVLLGRWLERSIGTPRMLACYLASTLTSIGLFPLFATATLEQPQIVVGASGGVMGLLGALLGVIIIGRTQGRSRVVSAQFNALILLVAMQVVFDLSTPNVSSLAHTLGLVTGLLFGLASGTAIARSAKAEA